MQPEGFETSLKKTHWAQSIRKILGLHIQFKVEFGTVVYPYHVLFGIQAVRETKAKWHIPTSDWILQSKMETSVKEHS